MGRKPGSEKLAGSWQVSRRWLKLLLIWVILIAAAGVAFYGFYQGDVSYVLENAKAYCYT